MRRKKRFEKKALGYYDGAPYAFFVERVTKGLHSFVAENVPADCRMIDICCGTGALACQCAGKCNEVLGVDLSPKMIAYAETQRQKRGIENIRFQTANAGALPDIGSGAFDFATLVMCLHEMPAKVRPLVLAEAERIARTVLIVDFVPRMHWNVAGVRNRLVEFAAGMRHFRGFLDFTKRGGLPPLLAGTNLEVERHGVIDQGNLEMYTLVSQTAKTVDKNKCVADPIAILDEKPIRNAEPR